LPKYTAVPGEASPMTELIVGDGPATPKPIAGELPAMLNVPPVTVQLPLPGALTEWC